MEKSINYFDVTAQALSGEGHLFYDKPQIQPIFNISNPHSPDSRELLSPNRHRQNKKKIKEMFERKKLKEILDTQRSELSEKPQSVTTKIHKPTKSFDVKPKYDDLVKSMLMKD